MRDSDQAGEQAARTELQEAAHVESSLTAANPTKHEHRRHQAAITQSYYTKQLGAAGV